MSSTGIIILAAGSSSRLGQVKQQLHFKGKTLLQKSVSAALDSACTPVVVVLGAYAGLIQKDLDTTSVHVVYNPDWFEGMASSIKVGLTEMQRISPDVSAIILMLCDQPFVEASLLDSMLLVQEVTGKSMVACTYQDTLGAPVLFTSSLFPELMHLQGAEGAKKLLYRYPDQVTTISFPKGAIDIDTLSDYHLLQQSEEVPE